MLKCFECESVVEIQHHHVVPRSKGGTKTIPLCQQCHFLAHGRNGKATEHGRLVKEGLQRAKKRGIALGSPLEKLREARIQAAKVCRKNGETTAKKYFGIIDPLRKNGMTWTEIANVMNQSGVQTPRGRKWYAASCRILYFRYIENIKKSNKILEE